jgi:prepilin-type processing-associated H-X9-DG protein
VFIEEHEQSIGDGVFVVANDKYADPDMWFDLPSDRHSQGCNLSFADGHVQMWHWKSPKKFKYHQQPSANQADHEDLYRMKASIPANL